MTIGPKKVLVLARRDANEAMRVAAGLTIRDNIVSFVILCPPENDQEVRAMTGLEMLELAEITPMTVREDWPASVTKINQQHLSDLFKNCERVVSF